jgi:hypothetical protein
MRIRMRSSAKWTGVLDPRVGLLGEDHLHVDEAVEECADLRQLRDRLVPDVVRDVEVLALDGDPHGSSSDRAPPATAPGRTDSGAGR